METIGRLVGGVAHDFANLLTLIEGYSDLLLSRISQSDSLRPELEEIHKAAHRGSRLTAQLLGFTRGKSVEPRLLDLNAVITDLRRMLDPIIGEHVELVMDLSPNLDKVLIDPGQIEQVLMNLILNARDAMPRGGKILIRTWNSDLDADTAEGHGMKPGGAVLVSIRDTGHGMEPEVLQHVWEPFFTTKDRGKGTGLGLYTVAKIVNESHGHVWAESTKGEGSVFTVCLPRVGQKPSPSSEKATPIAPVPVGSETVLVVEDEEGVRRLLTQILHRRGYRVLEASNGQDALRLFEEHGAEIDLVLTDMVMPKMTGRELAGCLEQIRPGTKVIFMSGYTDDVLVRTGALGPGMSFLQKPLRTEALIAKVREALDRPQRPFNRS